MQQHLEEEFVSSSCTGARVVPIRADIEKFNRHVGRPDELIFQERVFEARIRRLVDLVLGSVLLALSSPILIAAAIAIALEDGGPILFMQRRVGRFGRLFTIYKLRTMRKEKCADGVSPSSAGDPRITRVGAWLRKTSIDELPQLFNVIRGDMTFVGPRPEMPFLVRNYHEWQHLRHLVKPGITGLWQITCRKTVPLHLPEATMLDIEYIRNISCTTDVALLAKTVKGVIRAQGAY